MILILKLNVMRLTYLVIGVLLLLVTSSCNSEDDTSTFNDPLLDGSIYRGDLRLRTQSNLEFYGNLGITKIEGLLRIQTQLDDPIVDLTPLNSIHEVEFLEIVDTPGLVTLEGLENLQTGFIYLEGNVNLENMNALNLDSTPLTYMGLVNLYSFNDYSSLSNIEEIGTLALYNMPLTNLEPFNNIKRIQTLSLSYMNDLEDLTSLHLEYVGRLLAINRNNNLESLAGLESIQGVGEFCEVEIYLNPSLTDFCSLTAFTQPASAQDLYTVWGNGFNPTFQDLLDGNCN